MPPDDDIDEESWVKLWQMLKSAEELPSRLLSIPRARTKSSIVNCTIDHNKTKEYTLAVRTHKMRSAYADCRSKSCAQVDDICFCRYKLNICEESDTIVVYQQGCHVTTQDASTHTTSEAKLTPEMEAFLSNQLSVIPDAKPMRLFGVLVAKINDNAMEGPAPARKMVENFVRRWRRSNRADSFPEVVEYCNQRLVEEVGLSAENPTDCVVLCDVRDDDGTNVADLGDGSELHPFHVGLTSFQLLEAYVAVQLDTNLTTIIHLDSTFKVNQQRYPVFVIGMSDKCGHFFPVVYFCTSQRKKPNVAWCLKKLDYMLKEQFNVPFAPDFVMMDADQAQFNACSEELPNATILMCWFHVIQNVLKRAKANGVDCEHIQAIFADLYDLHFSSKRGYEGCKQQLLDKWKRLPRRSAARKLTNHISKMWIKHAMFSWWQAFHTPAGCAATNNPLEQYHRTFKINCANSKATQLEMMQSMDAARAAFLAEPHVFSYTSEVSKRLNELYKTLVAHNCLTTLRLPRMGSSSVVPYRVVQRPLPPTAEDKRERMKSIKSLNARRMQMQNMAPGGWGVDTDSLSCRCMYYLKHNMCVHVIAATVDAGIRCPGLQSRVRRYVPNIRRSRRSSRGGRSQETTAEYLHHSAADEIDVPVSSVSGDVMDDEQIITSVDGGRDHSTALDTDWGEDSSSSSDSSSGDADQGVRRYHATIKQLAVEFRSNQPLVNESVNIGEYNSACALPEVALMVEYFPHNPRQVTPTKRSFLGEMFTMYHDELEGVVVSRSELVNRSSKCASALANNSKHAKVHTLKRGYSPAIESSNNTSRLPATSSM